MNFASLRLCVPLWRASAHTAPPKAKPTTATRLAILLATLPTVALAASPAAWEWSNYQDFIKGRFSGVALSRDGRVTLAPTLDTLFDAGEAAVWSVAQTTNGTLYLGTGHKGRLYRLTPGGKPEVIFTAGEAEIFAVTTDTAGRVYAGTSPGGKVYRIENGKASEYFNPAARYIWSLAIGKDGALYVGTGDEGKVFRVTAAGAGEVWYETGQSHVTAVALDAEGRLLAGTEPNGLLYRIAAKDRAFVLFDGSLPEIRSVIPGPEGSVYVAAMGGSVARQTAPAPAGGTSSGGTPAVQSTISVTVTDGDAAAQQGGDIKPKPAAQSATPAATAAPAAAPMVEYAGVEKAAIYRINADNTFDTLWSSKEENLYDIALAAANTMLLGTDNQGRIYELDLRTRKTRLIAETREGEVLRLLPASVAATGTQGKLLRLGPAAGSGELESTVHDATNVARWGKLTWRADGCNGCNLAFRTRTGNSARPDKTWSDWSEPLTQPEGATLASPNARFVQWRAELTGAGGQSPSLDWVRLAYLPQNTAPSVKAITVTGQTAATAGKPAAAAGSATATYSITITDTGETGASSAGGTATQPVTRAATEQIYVSWSGEDSDGDKLIYSLYFRGEAERDWKPLKLNTTDTTHILDAETLADGRYFFRVAVSDRLTNPAPNARDTELESAPILVDRTPPRLTTPVAPKRNGAVLEFRIEAADAASPLKTAEYSMDAGPWAPLAPADGVIDSLSESFPLRLEQLAAGDHMVVVRVYDSANNAAVVKLTVK